MRCQCILQKRFCGTEILFPTEHYDRNSCLALPKLNLQFLTIYDYLLRNFNLFRLESTYEIREDLAKCLWRIRPRLKPDDRSGETTTVFTGYSRMGSPVNNFVITSVAARRLGENKPAQVKAEISIDLAPFSGIALEEWKGLREHDVLFLVKVDANKHFDDVDVQAGKTKRWGVGNKSWQDLDPEELGCSLVRGCEILQVRDEEGEVIGERDMVTGVEREAIGSKRTIVVELDSAQYQLDMTRMAEEDSEDPYQGFNLLVRRQANENNFKAVLTTIRELMNVGAADTGLPDWLANAFLGYGDWVPATARRALAGTVNATLSRRQLATASASAETTSSASTGEMMPSDGTNSSDPCLALCTERSTVAFSLKGPRARQQAQVLQQSQAL